MINKEYKLKELPFDSLKSVQNHLKNLGLYSGEIDGYYGPLTFNAWVQFKESVGMGAPDKLDLIGPASYTALIESALGRPLKKDHDFTTKQGTVEAIIWECKAQKLMLKTQWAYVIATVEHETDNTFQPIEEYGNSAYFTRLYEGRADLGNTVKGDGARFRGRGYVQITGRRNYKLYSDKMGIDLLKNPHLAKVPNVALFILVDGFKNGRFTGHSLERYIHAAKTDFVGARRCINGNDRAGYIAQIANGWLAKL